MVKEFRFATVGLYVIVNILIGLTHFGLAVFSRYLASANSITPVWIPDGFATGITLIYGKSVLPGVFLGSFLANTHAFRSSPNPFIVFTSIIVITGLAGSTALATWFGTHLYRRNCSYRYPFERVSDAIKFLIYAGLINITVNATVSLTLLCLARQVPWQKFPSIWPVWWISNVAGIFMLAPLLLSLHRWHKKQRLKGICLQENKVKLLAKISELIILTSIIFCIGFTAFWNNYPIAYMLIPLLVWAVFRFGDLGAMTSMFAISGIAILGTVRGLGTFASKNLDQSLLGLQSFIAVVVFTTLILIAVLSEQSHARAQLKDAFFELQAINSTLEKQTLQLSYNNQELEHTLEELKSTQAQMIQSEKMSALGNLIAGVAHEINNPIGFLNGSLDNLRDYIQDLLEHLGLYQEHYSEAVAPVRDHAEEIDLEFLVEDLPAMLDSMMAAINRIKSISTSLGIFSRADTEYKVSANLHEGIDSTLLILKYRLKANDRRPEIQVIKDYGELPLVQCFPGQLNQVFMNILANAIDALDSSNAERSFAEIQEMPNRITLCTKREGERVTLTIADNGTGIPESVKARIFDRLFTTKGVGKGTGLGLSIARQIIVEKHGGTIEVNSEPDRGTEFILTLPVS